MTNPVPVQSTAQEAEHLVRMLELELIQKRTAWNQASKRRKSYRSLAFFFLFLLFAGGLLGFFFVFSRVNEQRQSRPPATLNH